MAALDTNVLVRLLVQDDARQGAAATRLIRRSVDAGGALFVPVTVVLADCADCLHAALALVAGEQPLWTFDKAAAKVDGAKLLPP